MITDIFFPYFGTFLYKTKISQELYSFIDSIVDQTSREKKPFLHGIVKIQDEYELNSANQKIFQQLMDPYFKSYSEAFDLTFEGRSEVLLREHIITNAWINYQKKNEIRSPHAHSNCDMSFVIYYDVPQQIIDEGANDSVSIKPGSITFMDQVNLTPKDVYPRKSQFSYMPQSGDMFLFPHYLLHYVLPFKSDCTRISLAGNVTVNTLS